MRRAALIGAFLLVSTLAAEEVSRLQQVTEELTTLQTVVQKLPEGRERKKLEERRALLERESEILQQRAQLELREAAVVRRLQANPTIRLQDHIRSLAAHAQPQETRLEALAGRIRAAVAAREALVASRQKLLAAADEPGRETKLAALDEQLLNSTEEIEALQLRREAVEHGLDVAREAERILARLQAEPATPALHLRAWWERRRELAERGARLGLAAESARSAAERRSAAADTLGLSREKLERIDEEIALLAPQTGFFRSTPGVDRLLAAARRDKESVAARLPALEAQHAALEESAAAALQLEQLLSDEFGWLRHRQETFGRRLQQWFAWPAGAAAVVVALFFVISRLVLPKFYGHEMLVSARRVNRYFMVGALATVLAGFFFEDLRVLATTLGIVSAALVIALQDVFASVAGWFAIIVSRKVRVGDRVEIDGVKGDVLEIELLRTTLNEIDGGLGLDHPSGRIVAIPNSFIFRSRVHNATHTHRWVWLRTDMTVTNESPVTEATALVRRALEEETAAVFAEARQSAGSVEERYGQADGVYEPKLYTTMTDSGVTFTLLWLADYREVPAARDRIHRRLLAELERNPRVQNAYPTRREIIAYEQPPRAAEPTNAAAAAAPARLSAWPGSAN